MSTIRRRNESESLTDTSVGDSINATRGFVSDVTAAGGDDTVTVTAGHQTADGGPGTDTLIVDYSANPAGQILTSLTANASLGGYDGYYKDVSDNSHWVDFTSFERFLITTGAGADSIATGDGNDEIRTGGGNDTIEAGAGNDVLDGQAGIDTLNGQAGDDILNASEGTDTANGGTGTDTLVVNWSTSAAGAGNTGTFQLFVANTSEGGFNGGIFRNDMGEVRYTSIERFVISTGSGADSISTATGNDIVSTGAGNDEVNVGSGTDQADGGNNMDGSRGSDGISADLAGATTAILWDLAANTYSGPAGTSFTNFEHFGTIATGSGNDVIGTTGDAFRETISTGGGNDRISSFSGTDQIHGGTGLDTLVLDWTGSASGANNNGASAAPAANGTLGGFDGRFNRGDIGDLNYSSIERFEISTGSGADNITTASGDDIVNTGGGNDFVNFGSGNDSGDGGTGEDGFSADLATASAALSIDLETGASLNFANFEYVGTLSTGSGDDMIVTRNIDRDETINSGGGNDRITSRNGNDSVNGGTGTDTLVLDWSTSANGANNNGAGAAPVANGTLGGFDGRFTRGDIGDMTYSSIERFVISTGSGADAISTASGDDEIRTGAGIDSINAGAGNDYLDGGAAADSLTGGAGNDIYVVDIAGDTVNENANEGVDEIRTALASYSLATRPNVENLTGTGIVDQSLTGNGGDNVIDGGAGADSMTGGLGNDTYVVDNSGDSVVEALDEGSDHVRTTLASYTLGANVEQLTGLSDSGQILTGNDLVNVITGGGGDDTIDAGASNDQILAGAGNDSLDGGSGADQMSGGAGDDVYYVDSLADAVTEAAGQGSDEVRASTVYYFLGANVENLTGIRTGFGQALTGNGLANRITGTELGDRIDGGGGADMLAGGGGDDIYVVDSTGDGVTEAAAAGTDTIETDLASLSLADFANVENLVGTSASGQALSGSSGGNSLTGGTGNDILDGNGGTDLLAGGDGDDAYVVDSADDVVTELSGEGDADEVWTALSSYVLPENVEKLVYTGSGAASFGGNSANNALSGGAGGDLFDLGQGGDDSAEGLGGNDGFYMGDELSALDDLDGGAGANDQLILQGDVTATILAGHLQNIEVISILSGQETRFGDIANHFYDYSITMDDGAVDNGERLKVWAAGLAVGEDLFFDGSAESDGHFTIYAGMGTDHLIGGSGNDYFFFGDGRFTADDRIVGDGGTQDQLGLRGDYSTQLAFQDDTISGIDTIVLISSTDANYGPPGGSYDYNIKTHDLNVGVGEVLAVWGLNLTSTEMMVFDGSLETNGRFNLFGGAAADILIGGAGIDMIYGGLGGDTMGGNGGNDRFVYRTTGESATGAEDRIINFAASDRIDLSAIDADGALAGNQAFAFVDGPFTGAGQIRAVDNGGGSWTIFANTDSDLATAELSIIMTNGDAHPIAAADFVL